MQDFWGDQLQEGDQGFEYAAMQKQRENGGHGEYFSY